MKQQPPQALLMQAVALHQQGQLDQAKALYEQVLTKQPKNFDALHMQGVIAIQSKNYQQAASLIRKAISIDSKNAVAYINYATALQQLNLLDDALASHERAITLKPDYAEAHYSRGGVLMSLGYLKEALASYELAIKLMSDYVDAYNNHGAVLHELKRYDEAVASYERVIALKPGYAEAHYNRGNALQALKRFSDAVESYCHAIALKPDYAEAYNNRGVALQQLQRLEEAATSYECAIALRPDYAEANYNIGNVFAELKRLDAALNSYNRAILLKPSYTEAYISRGNLLQNFDYLHEALANYSAAIELNSNCAEIYVYRGNTLKKINCFIEAITSYERAIELQPDYDFLLGMLIHMRSQIFDFDGYHQIADQIKAKLENKEKVSQPFPVLALFDEPVLQKSAAEIWLQDSHPHPSPLGAIPHYQRQGKIRLAYYSADFHNHATAHLMAQLFECHDQERFELFAFSFGPDSSDPMRQRLVAAFDHFIDVRFESDQAVAQRSRDLGIDIAVDLKGYTQGQRVGIFAHRCAPVQVSYLGYPGTMGAPFMDYLIADKVVIPPESQEHYSEQVVYLPHSYQVNDNHRAIADTVWRKSDLGLPEEGFVYCCFNNSYKITPSTFASWMRILQAVPHSVLWLLGDNATAQRNLQQHAQAAGIDSSRLVFAPRMPLAEHLARHRAADLFLDTLPCNAHTTASDALWAGLPVLTQQGQAFAGRVAASLLHAVGLPELIVHTTQEYEELAIALARDPQRLSHIKAKLVAQRETAPLFNTQQLARHIEQAYAAMHERALAGLAAQGFEVV
jgi:protein O-GlcNAc transferase